MKIVEGFSSEKSVSHIQVGDLNADGYDDAIVGSRYSDANGLDDSGIIYIIFGKPEIFSSNPIDVTDSENVLTIYGNERFDYLGRSMSIGDINGDGIDDLLFGANNSLINSDSYKGNCYVLLGYPDISSRGLIDLRKPPADVVVITGDYEIGSSTFLGDINGDGFDDLILGAASYDGVTGAAYIILS